MPTKLFLVRHGETPDKEEKHDRNEGLSRRGYKEANSVAWYFRNTYFDFIYSSKYRRADATAHALKNSNYRKEYEILYDSLFNEISRPDAEGKSYSDPVLKRYFAWRQNIIYSPTEENVQSQFIGKGESYWKFLERCGQIPQVFSLPQFSGKNIIVYTHSQLIVTVQTWLRHCSKPTPEQLMAPFRDRVNFPKCGSITELVFDDGFWTIAKSNFIDHLPK